MAINKNHEFEELDGVKCGIVEKSVLPARAAFLKSVLEFNGYEVLVVPSPPPKTGAKTADAAPVEVPEMPATVTIGVTDYTFNPVNAIFGRMLKTPAGDNITLAYWKQEKAENRDDIPYYEK